jgi:hypothetical protein
MKLVKRLGRLVVILSVASVTSAFATCTRKPIPGIEEPTGWGCTLIDPLTLDCVHMDDPNAEPIERATYDSVGYICLPPRTYGDAVDHHNALHLYIEGRLGEGNEMYTEVLQEEEANQEGVIFDSAHP